MSSSIIHDENTFFNSHLTTAGSTSLTAKGTRGLDNKVAIPSKASKGVLGQKNSSQQTTRKALSSLSSNALNARRATPSSSLTSGDAKVKAKAKTVSSNTVDPFDPVDMVCSGVGSSPSVRDPLDEVQARTASRSANQSKPCKAKEAKSSRPYTAIWPIAPYGGVWPGMAWNGLELYVEETEFVTQM
eukprot:scaffold651_cov174-Ochromonas_danica.AAC.23